MRHKISLAASALILAGCEQASAPFDPPVFRVTATVTDDNRCTVSAMGKTYTSSGQVRGDKPAQFVGSMPNVNYHGFGCVVHADGVPGDIIVQFSRNNFGKPLDPGIYTPSRDIFDETRPRVASVRFDSQDYGPFRLGTSDKSAGTVKVEETANGGRLIIVDVEMIQWGDPIS